MKWHATITREQKTNVCYHRQVEVPTHKTKMEALKTDQFGVVPGAATTSKTKNFEKKLKLTKIKLEQFLKTKATLIITHLE